MPTSIQRRIWAEQVTKAEELKQRLSEIMEQQTKQQSESPEGSVTYDLQQLSALSKPLDLFIARPTDERFKILQKALQSTLDVVFPEKTTSETPRTDAEAPESQQTLADMLRQAFPQSTTVSHKAALEKLRENDVPPEHSSSLKK